VKANSDGMGRFKSLTPAGSILVPVPAPEPVALGQPVLSLRQVIPAEGSTGQFR
jgi:hypothetical protein